MAQSSIEWTQATWNPTTGCNKISSGCQHCYAEIMSRRLQSMHIEKYQNGFDLTLHPETLNIPYEWKKPKVIFVNSMSDLFHKDVPIEFIQRVFKVMNDCSHHTFQVLTKRGDILEKYWKQLSWTPNIWMGVSIENQDMDWRTECLRRTGAQIKFLSCEPLLGALPNLNLKGIDWVIVGGESGHKARQIKAEWVLDIRNQCTDANVAFFFKQWGGVNKKAAGRELEGQTYNEMPLDKIAA
jgi:protein gp37